MQLATWGSCLPVLPVAMSSTMPSRSLVYMLFLPWYPWSTQPPTCEKFLDSVERRVPFSEELCCSRACLLVSPAGTMDCSTPCLCIASSA